MLVMGFLKFIGLLFSILFGGLGLGSEFMSDELSEKLECCPKELARSIGALDWVVKLFQLGSQLSFLNLKAAYTELSSGLQDDKNYENIEQYVIKTVDKVYKTIMESGLKDDKMKSLRAMDRFLNNDTTSHLLAAHCNALKNFSKTMQFLSAEKIKPMDKDCNRANDLLKNKFTKKKHIATTDPNIWFLLNQMRLHPKPLEKFNHIMKRAIIEIIKCEIVLRADVELEHLFKNILTKIDHAMYWAFFWCRYKVEESPFEDIQLYAAQKDWKLIGKSLLLKDPKLIAKILDAYHENNPQGTLGYLLLLKENPIKLLTSFESKTVEGMYFCFIFASDIDLPPIEFDHLCKLPKERLIEIVEHLTELEENGIFNRSHLQLTLPYLSFVSLHGKKGDLFSQDHARGFAQNPKTLELINIIEKALLKKNWFLGKRLNNYLIENPDWDKAVEQHFHQFISGLILANHQTLTRSLVDYTGIHEHAALVALGNHRMECVNCTLEKIPRHLSSYLEILDRNAKKEKILMPQSRHFEIAVAASFFSSDISTSYKENLVQCHFDNPSILSHHFNSPVFVDFVRINAHYNGQDDVIKKIKAFLHFENLISNYFPNLPRMDPEKGFQRLSTGNSFSNALKKFIAKNFKEHKFPIVFRNFSCLKKALLKCHPTIVTAIQIDKIPMKVLLKTIYEVLGDSFSPDLGIVFIEHLFRIQLLYLKMA